MKRLDTTQGPLLKQIFIFSIPMIITTLMQHLFDIADKAVLGQMADATAVAAVGVTGTITLLILNGFVGLATGSGIVLARYVGQKDEKKIRQTIETALLSSLLFGCFVAVFGYTFAPDLLRLIDCPEECLEGAVVYIRIYLLSAPAALLYNYGSVIVRTLGDTRRPLLYITISGVANVILNVILCLILPQKVAAVAIATSVSKIISAILMTRRIFQFDDVVQLTPRRVRFHLDPFKQILRFGVPISITNLLLPLANLQVAPAINSYGVDAVAGNTAAADLLNIPLAFNTGFSAATSTFMGQNIGAQKPDRVRKAFWYTFVFAAATGGLIGILMTLSGEFWVGLIIGTSSQEAIDYAMIRMFTVTAFSCIAAASTVLGSAEHAYGYPVFGTISTIFFTLGFRVLWMNVFYPKAPTFAMVMICFTISWTLNAIFKGATVLVLNSRYRRGIYKKI